MGSVCNCIAANPMYQRHIPSIDLNPGDEWAVFMNVSLLIPHIKVSSCLSPTGVQVVVLKFREYIVCVTGILSSSVSPNCQRVCHKHLKLVISDKDNNQLGLPCLPDRVMML